MQLSTQFEQQPTQLVNAQTQSQYMQLTKNVSTSVRLVGQKSNMPTYRSLVQWGPLLLFAPCRTRSVARKGGRAGYWLTEVGGERRSDSGSS